MVQFDVFGDGNTIICKYVILEEGGNVMTLELIFTLYKVRTRLDPMKGGVTICGRTPQA